jgi:hypothetical protein
VPEYSYSLNQHVSVDALPEVPQIRYSTEIPAVCIFTVKI